MTVNDNKFLVSFRPAWVRWALLFFSVILIGGSFIFEEQWNTGYYDRFKISAGMILSALVITILSRELLFRRNVYQINASGIRFIRGNFVVHWNEIDRFSHYKRRNVESISIRLRPESRGKNTRGNWFNRLNEKFSKGELGMTLNGMDSGFEEIVSAMIKFAPQNMHKDLIKLIDRI